MKPITKQQIADAALQYFDAVGTLELVKLVGDRAARRTADDWHEHTLAELLHLCRQYQQQHALTGEQLALNLSGTTQTELLP